MASIQDKAGDKRKRPSSPPPWQQRQKPRQARDQHAYRSNGRGGGSARPQSDQVRLNQLQDDERMREWVSQEDDFVLKQAKKKAAIRIREGRPKSIDWLCRTLQIIDPIKDSLDDEPDEEDLEFVEPSGMLEGLSDAQLTEMQKDIVTYMCLEKLSKNIDFWRTMKILCDDKVRRRESLRPEGRALNSVSIDIDRLLSPKSSEELEKLEGQIRTKLSSQEPVDTDYWQQLLDSLLVWKAKAKLKKISQSVLASRLNNLKLEMKDGALMLQEKLQQEALSDDIALTRGTLVDPDPILQLRTQDRHLSNIDETAFLSSVATERSKIRELGYVPVRRDMKKATQGDSAKHSTQSMPVANTANADHSQTTSTLYNKELARGFGEDEEIFTGEEEVETYNKDTWMGKHRPRKPKHFNRVQMGYEWNKYNQTHYDHDNPPPKVVQGYKFHIFYPDLIDKTKAPTYKIEREDGRKKGQSTAPAGEEDTCIIKFIAGPPYETIAFRIIDRDWDYSAKYDRGFKSTFESPGILTLNFSFKKIYYRK